MFEVFYLMMKKKVIFKSFLQTLFTIFTQMLGLFDIKYLENLTYIIFTFHFAAIDALTTEKIQTRMLFFKLISTQI